MKEQEFFRQIHLIVCRAFLLLKDSLPKKLLQEYNSNLYKAERKYNWIQKTLLKIKRGRLMFLSRSFKKITDTLVSHNLRLVISIARKNYSNKGVDFFDLIHEGSLGLMVSIFKFDYTFKCKFSTYSIH